MRTGDTGNGYGWISIALHWTTTILVLTIWFIGSSIQAETNVDYERVLRLHTSIAICAYLLLWARIIWRFVKGHPGPLPGQAGIFYTIGKYLHFVLLIAIACMLVSGPMMVWATGDGIHVFDWFVIPSPFTMNMLLHDAVHVVHVWCSRVIIVGTVLHIGGVYKHAAFNQDGTFGKMLVAARKD
ncbi:MAG TPA: cytochrome b/b6 domain-containing protein [Gammaproteobacteria bacterium]|nr:cytochrome b/b6 domain-containing protein [Gammaproteobacteria bacterium]